MNLLTGVIVARQLGPSAFGSFNFLLNSFISIMTLLDLGTSSAFYTFVSKKKQSLHFYLYYFIWLGIQFLLVLLFISTVFPESLRDKIWLGHKKELIILSFAASFLMSKLWKTIVQAGESIRATVLVQVYSTFLALANLFLVLLLAFFHYLAIDNLFKIIIVLHIFFSVVLTHKLRSYLVAKDESKISFWIKEYKIYCLPLMIYCIVSFAYSFADLWLLQKFGGSVQQGFFSVGSRFSAVCLIATSSILNVFWKEITEANERGDKKRMWQLYTKITRGLFFVTALGACFLLPFSKDILTLFLGQKYAAGSLCLAIMFLFPIHQSLGQINGSYFFASAQTRIYSKIGIAMMMLGIPMTYFVLASPSSPIPGFDLGSVGLAVKMVFTQMIGVNIIAYFICKLTGGKFAFLFQLESIILLLFASFLCKMFFTFIFHVFGRVAHPVLLMILCGPVYVSISMGILYLYPSLGGLSKAELRNLIRIMPNYLAKIRSNKVG